jgi:tetratricopeptide (TPR) repeat protein
MNRDYDFFDDSSDSSDPSAKEDRRKLWKNAKRIVDTGELYTMYDSESLEELIHIFLDETDAFRALRVSEHWIAIAPYNTDGWFKKGLALGQAGNHEEAAQAFEHVTLLNPGDVEAYLHLGIALDNLGNLNGALEAYTRAQQFSPIDDEIYFCKAVALERAERFSEAEAELLSCVELNPNHPEAWYELGYCKDMLDRPLDSLSCYDRHLEIDPYSANTWYNRGIILTKLRRFDEAVHSYDIALAVRENFSSAWYNRGNVLANTGRLPEAIESYKMTLEYEPGDLPTLFNIAAAYEEQENYHQAIVYLEKCVSIDVDYAEAWYALACCYDEIDAPLFALNAINKALALEPESADFMQAKAGIEFQAGNYDYAIELYEESIDMDKHNPYIWFDYATALLDMGRTPDAIAALEYVISLTPAFSDAYFELACAYRHAGDTEKVIHALKESIGLDEQKKELFLKVFPELARVKSICETLGVSKKKS